MFCVKHALDGIFGCIIGVRFLILKAFKASKHTEKHSGKYLEIYCYSNKGQMPFNSSNEYCFQSVSCECTNLTDNVR